MKWTETSVFFILSYPVCLSNRIIHNEWGARNGYKLKV